jgi:hypothetical protein
MNITNAKDLLETFPEAKEIIDKKIDEWTRVKGKVFCKKILPILEDIDKMSDEFARWFWRKAFVTCALPERFKEATKQLKRLKMLKWYLEADKKKLRKTITRHEDFDRSKDIAKQRSIISVYPFQRLRKVGERYQALCPFHNEKTPSFVIYPNNTFYCFGCHVGGDAIDFIKLVNKCEFKEAIGYLATAGG